MSRILPVLVFALILSSHALASVTNTIPCTFAAVSNALVNVGEADEINVQAGSFTWTSAITMSGGKSFAFRGAGTNQTFITSGALNAPWWIQKTSSNGITTISGITFVGDAANIPDGFILTGGNSFNGSGPVRFTSCMFTNITGRGILVGGGGMPGLIDHCYFKNNGDTGFNFLRFEGDNDNSYTNASPLGTTNAVYVEDCHFDSGPFKGNGFWDSYDGAQFVVRHSLLDGKAESGTHGYDSSPNSARTFEIYNNIFTNGSSSGPMFEFRGGTGILCSNAFHGWQEIGELACYRCCLADHSSTGHGQLDGATTNVLDGNIDGTGYPGHQQVGVIRSFTSANHVSWGVAVNYQELLPIYQWQNVLNSTNANMIVQGPYSCGNQITNIIALNRDFFNGTISPSWHPLAYPYPLPSQATSISTNVNRQISGPAIIQGSFIIQ